MRTDTFSVTTGSTLVSDLTSVIDRWLRPQESGLLNVFVPHATAGVALIETGAGSETDLATILDHVLPRDHPYRHRHGSPGHGRDHVLPAFVSPSLVVPVADGRMLLGTWQSVCLVDPNVDNPRRTVRLSLLTN